MGRKEVDCADALATLSQNPRITVRRGGALRPEGRSIVYWMQRAQRALDNPALDTAIEIGNQLGLPVIAYFAAISNFPHASLRHYVFLNQGLVDTEADMAERNVTFIVRRPPEQALEPLLEDVQAAMVIGDENPCREPERWRTTMARRLRIPYWTVDADVVVPSNLFPKHQYMLHIFRKRLEPNYEQYLRPRPVLRAQYSWARPKRFAAFDVREDVTAGWKSFDRSVLPVESFHGGTHTAQKLIRDFVTNKLANYATRRNHPEVDGTSRLSPYLHFGHISPLTIALAVEEACRKGQATRAACDSYLSELIGWRELAVNFVKHVPDYDSLEAAPAWAQKTLAEHARDTRNPVYTLKQLERAETYDELWNAAQRQMLHAGWMHNYMRMYWAKKILEWSPSPAAAWDNAVYLNDRYFLDGRDPNGYAGVAWAIGGVHDRPWFDREIFGTIRYMSGASTGKKFDSKRYIRQMELLAEASQSSEG